MQAEEESDKRDADEIVVKEGDNAPAQDSADKNDNTDTVEGILSEQDTDVNKKQDSPDSNSKSDK